MPATSALSGAGVRADRAAQPLVSGESAGRGRRGTFGEHHECGDRDVSLELAAGRDRDPQRDVFAGGAALRRDAADAAATAGAAGRASGAAAVDRAAALHDGDHQSRARCAHSLGMVCGVAGDVRRCCGTGGGARGKDSHQPRSAILRADGDRGAGADGVASGCRAAAIADEEKH